MGSIALISQDLVDKLKTVTELQSRVGMALGGTNNDPFNRGLPLPAAWPVFVSLGVSDQSKISTKFVGVEYNYIVKLLVEYGTEDEIISIHLPLLENVVETIKGSEINGLPMHAWSYDGMTMESLDADRLVFDLSFSIATSL